LCGNVIIPHPEQKNNTQLPRLSALDEKREVRRDVGIAPYAVDEAICDEHKKAERNFRSAFFAWKAFPHRGEGGASAPDEGQYEGKMPLISQPCG
jgi:hypothetical protein